jgi:hypothetical protein
MVRVIEKFKEYFNGFEDNYIIIGGTACEILEESTGQQPRATKDIDIILIVEALTTEFVKRFWEFVKDGQYITRQHGKGKSEYFRFLKPRIEKFPMQIEIFARKPDILALTKDALLTPIPIDEDLSSLSAILMNDDYYHYTLEHSTIENGVRLANIESLIGLKAKAFLDLSDRKSKGESIDEKNIRKHKNDVFRLAIMLNEADVFSLPNNMQDDLNTFCKQITESLPNKAFFESIGFSTVQPEEVYERLCTVFQVTI